MSLLPSLWCETPAAGERGARREGQETLTGVERVGRARHRLDGDPLPAPRGIGGIARENRGVAGRLLPPQRPPPPPPARPAHAGDAPRPPGHGGRTRGPHAVPPRARGGGAPLPPRHR